MKRSDASLLRALFRLALACLAAALASCAATGPKFSEMASALPPVPASEGRVVFYRDSMIGAALAPDVRVDSRVVGALKPGSFIFVDLPAGRHVASASTEADARLDFSVEEGGTVYVRMTIGIGLVVGRPSLSLRAPAEARQALQSLAYGGTMPASPPATRGQAPRAEAPKPAPASPATQAPVGLDELRGLLPPTR